MVKNSELITVLNRLEMLFRYSGVYIKNEYVTDDRLKYRVIYFLHAFAASYQCAASAVWCVSGLLHGEAFIDITFTIPCLTINILAQFKGMFLVKHEAEARELILKMKELDKTDEERKHSAEREDIVASEWRTLNYVLKTLSIFYAVLVCGFSISPLVMILVKYLQTNDLELVLPFFVIYGFDPLQKFVWPFMYVHQCWSELAVVLNICSADYFFFVCCTYIRVQFLLLKYHFENVIPGNGKVEQRFMEDAMFKKKFNDLVKWHQDLIESSNILEIMYSKSTLLNFFSSSVIICLTGFNVVVVHDESTLMTFLSFLIVSLVQVFYFCFFADLLMISSKEIGDGVYNSKFYVAEPKLAKKLYIVLLRSQKPCKITAAGYADVNLKAFMRVLSSAWSYFALLQTMYSE